MESSLLMIQGSALSVDKTQKGAFIVKFLVGDKVLKVFTKENGIKKGDHVLVVADPPEDAKFPMLFEQPELRKIKEQQK